MDYRIESLREYLLDIIDTLTTSKKSQIKADFLDDVGDFSLDKIPTASVVTRWIDGTEIHRDVFSFRSRKEYSSDLSNNLKNIGFFEDFEYIIKKNNKNRELPDIKGIESIECLNNGSFNSVDGTKAIYDIQIQMTYKEDYEENCSI